MAITPPQLKAVSWLFGERVEFIRKSVGEQIPTKKSQEERLAGKPLLPAVSYVVKHWRNNNDWSANAARSRRVIAAGGGTFHANKDVAA